MKDSNFYWLQLKIHLHTPKTMLSVR